MDTGFATIDDLATDDLNKRYFANRTDRLYRVRRPWAAGRR